MVARYGYGLIMAGLAVHMHEKSEKKIKIIVDKGRGAWYNTPENKEGRCIRPHLQQWQRGQQRKERTVVGSLVCCADAVCIRVFYFSIGGASVLAT